MTTKDSHMVNLRLPDSYPLTGKECGTLLREIFPLLQAITNGELETYFKYHPEVRQIIEEKLKISLQVQDKTDPAPWKKGFGELYSFFKDLLEQINEVVTTKAGKDLWNKILHKRDLKVISDLGRIL
ncbi:MAG: hypothetical protein RBG13Loki_1839 [Promethearchaeota archaeon CR_4]|nr:MAG: hypothetical protein RBG13Loki_1839 [Candidatus Lokiarchaeota archaeon CR_4]